MSMSKENVEMDKIVTLLKKADDDGTLYDCIYKLYFYIEIAKGADNIRNGRGTPLKEFHKEMEALYECTRRRFG